MDDFLHIVLEGKPTELGDVRLDEFVLVLKKLHSSLLHTYQHLGEVGRPTLHIEDLSHNSPATAVLSSRQMGNELFTPLLDALENMGDGKAAVRVGFDTLNDLEHLSKRVLVGKLGSARIFSTSRVGAILDSEFHARIQSELAPTLECYSTVEGWLEALNLHGGANQFVIYPPSVRRGIKCRVPEELINEAISAIQHKVAVSGRVKYRPQAILPYEIEVELIETFDQRDVSKFSDLRGMVPDLTDGESTESFLERIRGDWH